ncbi:TPA: hypothetical protein ACUA6F_001692 [Escherichia coli]
MNAYEMLLLVAVIAVIAVDFLSRVKKMREADFFCMIIVIVIVAVLLSVN